MVTKVVRKQGDAGFTFLPAIAKARYQIISYGK